MAQDDDERGSDRRRRSQLSRVRSGSPSLIVGAAERVDLPEWGVRGLKAKVDTGARSSALHVDAIETVDDTTVRFEIVLDNARGGERVPVEARVLRRGKVKPSSGRGQERLFVETTLKLGPLSKKIEVSLAKRGRMRFRMLLGRTALAPECLVDSGRRYVHSDPSTRRTCRSSKAPRPLEQSVAEVPTVPESHVTPQASSAPAKKQMRRRPSARRKR